MKSKLFDFFPIPKTLAMHASGVAISDQAIQFVRFADKKELEVEAFGEIKLPPGVIESGSVKDPNKLTELLKELRRKHNLYLVEVSIPEEKSYLFKTSVLGENIKEIRSNLDLQIQENVPFKVSEVVFDFSIISGYKNNHRDVVVSVLPKVVVDQYLDVFHNAGYLPVSFQVESQAVAQAAVPYGNKETALVVNVQGDKAGFYIVTGQNVRFSSTVSIDGTDTMINILDESLIPKDEIEQSSSDFSILAREIKKILTYWRTHDGAEDSQDITHIYLTGIVPEEVKTVDYIREQVPIEVEIANVWQNAFSFEDNIPEIERKDAQRFPAAIGLALPNQE